tara:strand:- start:161 stop:373 length:213 start_codon:yes stop_codon:yes gene_type:complete
LEEAPRANNKIGMKKEKESENKNAQSKRGKKKGRVGRGELSQEEVYSIRKHMDSSSRRSSYYYTLPLPYE